MSRKFPACCPRLIISFPALLVSSFLVIYLCSPLNVSSLINDSLTHSSLYRLSLLQVFQLILNQWWALAQTRRTEPMKTKLVVFSTPEESKHNQGDYYLDSGFTTHCTKSLLFVVSGLSGPESAAHMHAGVENEKPNSSHILKKEW